VSDRSQPEADIFEFHCDCGRKLKARLGMVGKVSACPACGKKLTIPPPVAHSETEDSSATTVDSAFIGTRHNQTGQTDEPPERLKFECVCGQKLIADTNRAGDIMQCPKCKANVRVPGAVSGDQMPGASPPPPPGYGPQPPPPGYGPQPPLPGYGPQPPLPYAHGALQGYPALKLPVGLAVASMVCGIVGALIFCLWFISIPLGIIATILGAVAIGRCKKGEAAGKGMAITGLVLGIIVEGLFAILGLLVLLGGLARIPGTTY